jgi:hypothetical protein
LGVIVDRRKKTRVRLAIGLVAIGTGLLALLFWRQEFPRPVWLWGLFAATFVFLEWRAVEVNDRLFASPSIMVAFTAAAIFGKGSAVLGVALMAALGPLTPLDVKERRWFQPLVNFGQLVITATVSISVLELALPTGPVGLGDLWRVAAGAGIAAMVHGAVNYNVVTFIVHRAYGVREVQPWSQLAGLHVPYLGMGFLGGLLGATYLIFDADSSAGSMLLLPLIFVVFFVGHMTFASYGQLREAQESTLRGFVKALEAKDLYTRGHTERVAHFARLIGERLGFNGTQLERLRWASLIHDVGKLAVPRELIRKDSRFTDEERRQMESHVALIEDLLSEVDFLRPMVQIATQHHIHYDGSGYGGRDHVPGTPPGKEACILAVADAFDAMTSTRSYRPARSQEQALDELDKGAGTQFDPEAVAALRAALTEGGMEYGAPAFSELGDRHG